MAEIEKSSILHNHQIKTRTLQFEVKVGQAGVGSDLSIATIANGEAADGIFTVTLSSDDIGEVEKVRIVEVLDAAGTTTASAALSSGNIVITADSDQNLSLASDTIELRLVYKIKSI